LGDFRWRFVALVVSVYLVLAVVWVSLAYSEPGFRGLVLPPGSEVVFFDGERGVAVFSFAGSGYAYWGGFVFGLGFGVSSACYDGSRLFVAGGSRVLAVRSNGVADVVVFDVDARVVGVVCGVDEYAVLASNESLLVVRLEDGAGFRLGLGNFSSVGVTALWAGGGVYVASGSRVVFFGGGVADVYVFPEEVSVSGLAVSSDGLVVYGSWGDKGFIYRFGGEAMLLEVPGRVTSVDALACSGYRCVAVMRPVGDWLILAEFNMWRYVSHVKVVATKPYVYHGSGSSGAVWASGEIEGLGVVVVEAFSTREAVVGFNSTLAVVFTEKRVEPPPKLSKLAGQPSTFKVETEPVKLSLARSSEGLDRADLEVKTVKAQVDRLSVLATLTALATPALVYLYALAVRESRGGARPPQA